MKFTAAVKSGFRESLTFSGRATRAEFWYWWLFVVISPLLLPVLMLAAIAAGLFGLLLMGFLPEQLLNLLAIPTNIGLSAVAHVAPLAALVAYHTILVMATAAVSARRAHDFNTSGWLPALVPAIVLTLIGASLVQLFITFFFRGESGGDISAIVLFFYGPIFALMEIAFFLAISMLVMVVTFMIVGTQRGTLGPNDYGPDPLQVSVVNEPMPPAIPSVSEEPAFNASIGSHIKIIYAYAKAGRMVYFFGFTGRATRSEFWAFIVFLWLLDMGASLIDGLFFAGDDYLELAVFMLTLIPLVAITIRRLHDIDKTGWWAWIMLIPFIGLTVLFLWFCKRGTPGPNRFGLAPLGT